MSRTRIAILASGSGSTAEAFIRTCVAEQYPLEAILLICNNPDAYVLERIKTLKTELGISLAAAVINSKTQPTAETLHHGQQTSEEQQAILALLTEYRVDLVLLLGYMKLIGPQLLTAYGWLPEYQSVHQARMLNTHPGLLPDTIGTHGLGTQAFTLKHRMSAGGQSLHAVSAAYDQGPVVAEHRVPTRSDDTPETLFARVQAVEKQYIAADVMKFVAAQKESRVTE